MLCGLAVMFMEFINRGSVCCDAGPVPTEIMRQLLSDGALLLLPSLAHAEGIVVLSVTCAPMSAEPHVQGELRNDTNKRLDRVKITRPLLPAQVSPFEFYGDKNPVITYVMIVISVNNSLFSSSGMARPDCSR
jgi:hypothetical protein